MPAPHDISIRQLQYAVAVAETGGFHRAAARCHVSQPALSTQIQQLESVLGVVLFERGHRGVLVTPDGEALLARARRVLVEIDDLLAAARSAGDPLTGALRVGVIPTVAPYLLPEITPALMARFPGLRPTFREGQTADVMRELREGRLDAALVALEAELGEVAHVDVLHDPFVAALPREHPLARRARIALSELDDETVLLLDDGHCLRDQALALCAKAGAHEADFRATSLATLVQMVSAGAGITLLPRLAVDVENRRGQLEIRPLSGATLGRTLALVFRPNSARAEALRQIGAEMSRAADAMVNRERTAAREPARRARRTR